MQQPIILARDVEAIAIPSGTREVLKAGHSVTLSQSFGDSFTVLTDFGYQFRIDAKDADALRLATPQAKESHTEFSERAVWDQLKTIFDPEIPVNIVDLGLIYDCRIEGADEGKRITITMTMTAPGCGMADVLKSDIERKLRALPEVEEVAVAVVFDPPWHPGRMSDEAKLQLGFDLDYGSENHAPGFPMYGRQ